LHKYLRMSDFLSNFAAQNWYDYIMDYQAILQRYFLVIRELHEMGYELIRVCPCVSPNGMSWRRAQLNNPEPYTQFQGFVRAVMMQEQ
jgi:hypothetical protein